MSVRDNSTTESDELTGAKNLSRIGKRSDGKIDSAGLASERSFIERME